MKYVKYGLYVALFILLIILIKKDKNRKEWIKVAESVVLAVIISSLMGVFSNPITEGIKGGIDFVASLFEEKNEVSVVTGSAITTNQEKEKIVEDEELKTYTDIMMTLPVEGRITLPKESNYKDVSMMAYDYVMTGLGYADRGYGGKKTSNSMAVARPFVSRDEDDLDSFINEIKTQILKDPVFAHMILQGLGFKYNKVLEKNKDLFQFYQMYKKAFPEANNGVSVDEIEGLNYCLRAYEFPDEEKGIFVTKEYRIFAEKLCGFIVKLKNVEIRRTNVQNLYASTGIFHLRDTFLLKHSINNLKVLTIKNKINGVDVVLNFDLDDKSLCF